MSNQEHLDDLELDLEFQEDKQPESKPEPEYMVVREFSHRNYGRVKPGDALPDDISDVAIASLLRKGVLKKAL